MRLQQAVELAVALLRCSCRIKACEIVVTLVFSRRVRSTVFPTLACVWRRITFGDLHLLLFLFSNAKFRLFNTSSCF